MKTEKNIYKRIKELEFIKCIIAVTHRESILNDDDNCIFINNGEIVYDGKYKNYEPK